MAKVPRFAPSLTRMPVTLVVIDIGDPDAVSVERNTLRRVARREHAKTDAITGPRLDHGVVSVICHPDVGTVKSNV